MKDNWIVMMCLLKNCFEPIVDFLGAEFVCFVTHLGSTRCVLLVEFQVKVDNISLAVKAPLTKSQDLLPSSNPCPLFPLPTLAKIYICVYYLVSHCFSRGPLSSHSITVVRKNETMVEKKPLTHISFIDFKKRQHWVQHR